MSLIELLCAIAVLMVAALGFSRALVTSMNLAEATRQHTLAAQAARDKLEELADEEFPDVLALYNSATADDPLGAGTAPGAGFTVEGLAPLLDDADGLCGEIEFPTTAGQLLEDALRPDLGLPRDLDGSGDIDGGDHALDYVLLPVRVAVRWHSSGGPMLVEVKSFLAQR